MLDAGNEAVRFARTRAGDDEDGAEGGFDGQALLGKRRWVHAHLKKTSETSTNRGNRIPKLYPR